jgi:hypothetical protein
LYAATNVCLCSSRCNARQYEYTDSSKRPYSAGARQWAYIETIECYIWNWVYMQPGL